MRVRLQNKANLGMAAVFMLVCGANFVDRDIPNGFWFHRYTWFLWLVGSALWTYRAFRPDKPNA